jgi:hypothetical protein
VSKATQLKKDLDEEIQAIWLNEPDEIKKLRMGIIDSKAGSYGQYFTTYLFVDGEVRALGYLSLTTILNTIRDPGFELSHIYKLSRSLLPVCAEFLGYCGLNKVWEFIRRYLDTMEEIDSREELKDLVRSLTLYVNRMHGWVHFYAPWGLGTQFRFKTEEDAKELQRLTASKR